MSLGALLWACGGDDAVDPCDDLEQTLCGRTAECVAAEDQRVRVRNSCRDALDRQLICRGPERDEGLDFELCVDAARSMSCEFVLSAYQQGTLLQPDSCAPFLDRKLP